MTDEDWERQTEDGGIGSVVAEGARGSRHSHGLVLGSGCNIRVGVGRTKTVHNSSGREAVDDLCGHGA